MSNCGERRRQRQLGNFEESVTPSPRISGRRRSTAGRDWLHCTIGDIGEVIGGGTPSTKNPDNFGGAVPWLTPRDLSGPHERHIRRGARNLSQEGLANCSAKMLPAGTVLLSTRAPIGYVAVAANPIATNQGFRSIIVKPEYDPNFLYYWLKINTQELERHATGSTFRELSGSALKEISVRLPRDKIEQSAIAQVLGTLDDKIELNRQMNETLEAMAQALFKSWFVDFDPVRAKMEGRDTDLPQGIADLFPDRLVNSEMGEIPEGWEVKPLRSFGEVVTGKTPRTGNRDFYGSDIPFLKIPDMRGKVFVVKTRTMLSRYGAESQSSKTLPSGSVSVSCIATPGLVVLNHQTTQTNQQINSIVPHEFMSGTYLYWSCRQLASEIMLSGSGGSVVRNMNKTDFSALKTIDAGDDLRHSFDEAMVPIHQSILTNEKANQCLAAIRDTLLPKLISGEIRVPDVERALVSVT